MNRRTLLKQAGLLAALSTIPGIRSFSREPQEATGKKKVAVRFAHLTDVHMKPELRAAEGLAVCMHHLQSQKLAPSFIVSGGDTIFDA
jgi:3',5'-cyclic-AMP phosphodiesterase